MWLTPLLLLTGLFVPGALIARRLDRPLWWAAGFVFSLLILFQIVFWLEVLRVPIALGTVLPCLGLATAAAALWARRTFQPVKGAPTPPWDLVDRVLLAACAVAAVALVARTALAPLLGFDTTFRWDFLAQRILSLGHFRFYPPLTPDDFRTYFYVDGIPPLVSFANWWVYASAGGRHPALLSLFAGAQFAGTLAFVYGAAAEIFSRKAGLLAAATLAACPLFFNAVAIEQETGLTALALAATVYFLLRAREPRDTGAMVSGGLAAAVCALSREYGWIALIAGAALLLWRRFPRAQLAIFVAVAAAGAAPWYVRNLALAGNPFYSIHLGPFAVNPIHDGIMQYGRNFLHLDEGAALLLLALAPLQVLAGIPAAAVRFRERGYLAAAAALVGAAWLQSVGYTSAGTEVSLRVLSPAMAVLSIAASGVLVRWRAAATAAIVACLAWTVAQGSVYPGAFSSWPEAAFKSAAKPAEFQVAEQLASALPKGTRILTDNAYLHAALSDKGVDVVPVWSPEVRFLFGSQPEEADRRLAELRIDIVAYYPRSLNTRYLSGASPFYASLPQRWRSAADVEGFVVFYHR